MKINRSIIASVLAVFCGALAMAGAAPQIKTDKDIYRSGETIQVNFADAPGNSGDWICITAADSPDDNAGDYQYMPKGVAQGVLRFEAPSPGKYEARAYYNYSRKGYVVSGRYGFTVVSATATLPTAESSADHRMATVETKSAESPVATIRSGDFPQVSVSVFHFTPLTMDASSYGITATNAIVNSLKNHPSLVMLDRKDLETFLFANDLQQNDRTENAIYIGAKMGLNFVVTGSVENKGTIITTTCKVVSIEKRKVVFTNKTVSMGESDLIGKMTKVSDAIREAILRNIP